MVLEIAQIDVKPGMEAEFEAGVAKAAPIFKRARGCSSMALQKSVEKPSRYRLFVGWANGGEPHRRFPRLAGFPGVAQAGRPLLCLAAGSGARAGGGEGVLSAGRSHAAATGAPFSRHRRCPILAPWHPRPTSRFGRKRPKRPRIPRGRPGPRRRVRSCRRSRRRWPTCSTPPSTAARPGSVPRPASRT